MTTTNTTAIQCHNKLCFPLAHSQECQNVADSGNFFIQQGSAFCVNCPLSGSVQWTIGNLLLADVSPPLDYTILSNNSLLMRSSQVGSYQCEDSALTDTHQFIVILAGKLL